MRSYLLSALAMLVLPATAYASCPAVTVADMKGVGMGAYPQQFELAEFEAAAGCKVSFSANPDIAALNAKIRGNPDLPGLADRIPTEPLVVVPYASVGRHGGTLDVLSNATEAGTSDFLSVRHVNFVRYSDDLLTIVPNVAKDWKFNEDFTELTFHLRKGHKWSDGHPFTAEDVKFWYDHLMMDPKVFAEPKDYALVAGKRMEVIITDPQTVTFKMPAPKPGLLAHFATSYAQGWQPKHFLGKFHPAINPDANKLAKSMGFDDGYAVIAAYYGNSDWTDTPSPLLNSPEKVANLPADVVPTLESHITIRDTAEGRHYVANPYFHQVDPTGQQLPYISEQDEVYINDPQVRVLKLVNAEVDYKSQSLQLIDAPLLLENQEKGNYTVDLKPEIATQSFSFNVTSENPEKRKVFGDVRFRKAMSIAINRDEINDVAFFGQGVARQNIGFSPTPDFVDEKWLSYATAYDPDAAKALLDEVGMKDTDGDGFRELPNGEKIVLNMQFATQGISGKVVELVANHWSQVGVQTSVKEVTPDEYRSAQSANKLDVGMWKRGQPVAIVMGNNEMWVPPFGTYFEHRTGMLWAEWVSSNGANGVEPPAFVKAMMDDINAFQSATPGSAESAEIGSRLAATMTENLLYIGTVLATSPIYRRNELQNFTSFQTASYDYYRTYPYRATQWFLDE